MSTCSSRRKWLQSSAAGVVIGLLPWQKQLHSAAMPQESRSANERLGIGCIGLRYQGSVIAEKAKAHGDIVAVCDVDKNVREQARAAFGSTPAIYENYLDLLKRPNIDVVTIGTPDHWHTKMVIDACRAGKDVYCEKPLTLTIDEGKKLTEVVAQSDRVVQVGSWQRSDQRFRLAVEMVRQGRIGELKQVDVVLGKNVTGGPFPVRPVPAAMNWDLWQGQTPDVPYVEQRSHYTFRWWYEYSGGQMTDWGAHHIDIAQWAVDSLPVEIDSTAKFPVADKSLDSASYNVAIDFSVRYLYQNGVQMTVSDTGRNGILFSGTEGRLFVNRGSIEGLPVEQLATTPLSREQFTVYGNDNLDRPPRMGKLDAIVNHMGNFFDCVQSRKNPISDVYSQHRSVSTCHLGNISMRVGRPLNWLPEEQSFKDDVEANGLLSRVQRSGFETI